MTPGGSAGTAAAGHRVEPEPAGELREQIARWLCERRNGSDGWDHKPGRPYWLEDADALLSGPLAPLLAKLRAAEELVARAYPVIGARVEGTTLVVKADALRSALDAS